MWLNDLNNIIMLWSFAFKFNKIIIKFNLIVLKTKWMWNSLICPTVFGTILLRVRKFYKLFTNWLMKNMFIYRLGGEKMLPAYRYLPSITRVGTTLIIYIQNYLFYLYKY